MVRIQLETGYLDVKEGTVFPLNFGVADIRDLQSRSGTFSKTITLLGNKNNNKLLNNYYDVNIQAGTFNIDTLTTCSIIQNGVPILEDAYLQLISVNKYQKTANHEEYVEYNVLVKDAQSDFFTKLDNSELTDLDFTDLNHTYSAANVLASFNNTVADGYVYPLTLTADTLVPLNEFKPAIYGKVYWDRIHAGAGVQYEWASLSDCLFDKTIIPYNGGGNAVDNTDFTVEANVAKTIDGYQTAGTNVSFNEVIDGWTETLDAQSIFDPATGEYNVPFYVTTGQSITYQVTFNYEVRLNNATGGNVYLVDMTGGASTVGYTYRPSLLLLNNATGIGSWNPFQLYGGGIFYTRNEGVLPNGATTIGSNSFTLNVTSSNLITADIITLQASVLVLDSPALGTTNVRWKTTNSPAGVDALVDVQLVINSMSIKVVPSSNILFTGATIAPNDYIPKQTKQKDFIKAICTMYNLFVEQDVNNPNKLIYTTRDAYYDAGAERNWTSKIIKEKEQTLQFLPELTSKKVAFTYKPDKDAPNVTYLEAINENYGQVEFTFDNEYIKGKAVKEILFSPTPMAYNSFGAIVPQIVGSVPNINIRILLHNGVQSCNEYDIIDYIYDPIVVDPVFFGELDVTTYPMISHFNDHINPTFDINFGVCDYYYYDGLTLTNNNLYNTYWRRTINQINTGKMLIAYFDLNELDIQKLRLNDKIRINNSWWFINKVIDYNANGSEFTKVELMSIDTEIDFAPFQTRRFLTGNPRDFKGSVIRHFQKVNNVNLSEGSFIIKGIGNVVQENVKGFSEGNVKNINTDGIYQGGSLVGDNFANADLTFTGDRNRDTAGSSLAITTDGGLYGEGYIYLTPTLAGIGADNASFYIQSGNALVTAGGIGRISATTTTLRFQNSLEFDYTTKTANYTITDNDFLIDCTSGTFTVTLLTALNRQGRQYIIKNSGAGTITLEGDGTETIDGSLNLTLETKVCYTIISDGANWIIINAF